MRSRSNWKFSAAAMLVDLVRVVEEASRAVYPAPAVLRVTLEGNAKNVITLVHKDTWEGFLQNAKPEVVDSVLEFPRLPVDHNLKTIKMNGECGIVGIAWDCYAPEGDAEWIAIMGDHVGPLCDRIEVQVEVF